MCKTIQLNFVDNLKQKSSNIKVIFAIIFSKCNIVRIKRLLKMHDNNLKTDPYEREREGYLAGTKYSQDLKD